MGDGCEAKRWNDEPCGRRRYDDKHCIFHSKDIEGKKAQFKDEFWMEFERQEKQEERFDFSRFVFPGRISFEGKVFEKDSYFLRSKFSEAASFRFTTFSGLVHFESATFSGYASFRSATFSKRAYFNSAQFLKESYFQNIRITEHTKINMTKTYLDNVTGLFEVFEKHRKILPRAKKQELLPDDIEPILGTVTESAYPIFSRKAKDDLYLLRFQKKHPKLFYLWWIFADCGRSLWRWATWSLIFAIYFAFNFFLIDYSFTDAFKFNSPLIEKSFLSYVYYSVVTFTTLGFGDITPIVATAQKWVMAEVITGYIMLGGLISILANKLARRS